MMALFESIALSRLRDAVPFFSSELLVLLTSPASYSPKEKRGNFLTADLADFTVSRSMFKLGSSRPND